MSTPEQQPLERRTLVPKLEPIHLSTNEHFSNFEASQLKGGVIITTKNNNPIITNTSTVWAMTEYEYRLFSRIVSPYEETVVWLINIKSTESGLTLILSTQWSCEGQPLPRTPSCAIPTCPPCPTCLTLYWSKHFYIFLQIINSNFHLGTIFQNFLNIKYLSDLTKNTGLVAPGHIQNNYLAC